MMFYLSYDTSRSLSEFCRCYQLWMCVLYVIVLKAYAVLLHMLTYFIYHYYFLCFENQLDIAKCIGLLMFLILLYFVCAIIPVHFICVGVVLGVICHQIILYDLLLVIILLFHV